MVEGNREKDGLHRVVIALIGGRLRVKANPVKEPVKMLLVLSPKSAPEFLPVICGILNQLNESRDSSAHV